MNVPDKTASSFLWSTGVRFTELWVKEGEAWRMML